MPSERRVAAEASPATLTAGENRELGLYDRTGMKPGPVMVARALAVRQEQFGNAACDAALRRRGKRGLEMMCSKDQEAAIFAENDRRDCLFLHLLLKWGLRKAELRGVQFRHFDHTQLRPAACGKPSRRNSGGLSERLPIMPRHNRRTEGDSMNPVRLFSKVWMFQRCGGLILPGESVLAPFPR